MILLEWAMCSKGSWLAIFVCSSAWLASVSMYGHTLSASIDSLFEAVTTVEQIEPDAEILADRDVSPGVPGKLEDTGSRQIVRVNQQGELWGRISTLKESGVPVPIGDVTIHFVRNNLILKRVRPANNGEFIVRGLKPGVHAVIAAGPDGFVAFSINVARDRSDSPDGMLALDMQAVPPRDFAVIRELLTNHTDAGPKRFETRNDLGNVKQKGSVSEEVTIGREQVYLDANGNLKGRMQRLHPETGSPLPVVRTNIFLIQDSRVVRSTPLNESGKFQFEGIRPGVYSLATAGSDGFAAFPVQVLIPKGQAMSAVTREFVLTNLSQPVRSLEIDRSPVGPENRRALDSIVERSQFSRDGERASEARVAGPRDGGGLGGSGLGGSGLGGGGIGGSGSGGLAGALGLGLAAVALANNKSDTTPSHSPLIPQVRFFISSISLVKCSPDTPAGLVGTDNREVSVDKKMGFPGYDATDLEIHKMMSASAAENFAKMERDKYLKSNSDADCKVMDATTTAKMLP